MGNSQSKIMSFIEFGNKFSIRAKNNSTKIKDLAENHKKGFA
jgi:hypothetical protein